MVKAEGFYTHRQRMAEIVHVELFSSNQLNLIVVMQDFKLICNTQCNDSAFQ